MSKSKSKSKSKKAMAAAGVTALAVAGLIVTAGPATPANAAARACVSSVGLIAADGEHGAIGIEATTPPRSWQGAGQVRFRPGAVRLATNAIQEPTAPQGMTVDGHVVIGDVLYSYAYTTEAGGLAGLRRVGGGWSKYIAIESSWYLEVPGVSRRAFYGVRSDGLLTRWTLNGAGTFGASASYKLGDVKAMALISKTRTYDTFLVTTKAGALKTVRIPATTPLKPVVKTVRARSWQGFESLVAFTCGGGTVLTAIDKDTKAAYVYAIGRANGPSTPIKAHGKARTVFDAPVYHRLGAPPDGDRINGE